MSVHDNSNRKIFEQLLGKYLLMAGEVDMFITMSKAMYTGQQLSNTWIKKSLADKLAWYGSTLDLNVTEHARLVGLITSFDTLHRPFRNTLAHSALTLNVDENTFESINANGITDSITFESLSKKVDDLVQLKKDINEGIALSASAFIKSYKPIR